METNLDYRSDRAVQARFYAKFGKITQLAAACLSVMLVLAGLALLLAGYAIGWVVMSLGLWMI